MNFTTEQLSSIEDLAYRLIAPELVAINIGVDETDFVHEVRIPGTNARNAYYKGYLKQTIETREAIIKTAQNQPPTLQNQFLTFCS